MSTQAAFTQALLTPKQPCPQGLFSHNGADPASRFAVYRNNVHSSLINALTAAYPVTSQLVGEAFFGAMAGLYVQDYPPTSPLISEYGADFADFIQAFPPAASVAYLADVARLERLRVKAYHALDQQSLTQQAVMDHLQQHPNLARLRVGLHPSLFTLNSAHAVVAIWAAHQTPDAVATFDPLQPQSALVLREGLEVKVFNVDSGSVTFINSLNNGWPLEMALAYALDTAAEFDLNPCLALLVGHGAITHLHSEQEVSP